MIGYLRGQLRQVMPEGILVETGGIGWFVRTPPAQSWPPPGTEVAVYTHLVVREDALELYGFTRPEGLRFFTLLLGVAGIGPRGALQILAAAAPEQLARAIVAEDTAFLTALPGIGAKKARRLLLELKDAILKSGLAGETRATARVAWDGGAGDNDEALAALLALGYSRDEISPVLARVKAELGPEADTAAVLQGVLKTIGRGGGAD
ncbi:Holliday junction ATP-dependent DNA helicase RuvA [Neomoorella glycerini]|uniref:Holliday junction branch migration complex subunit RuvA n=1 Tax=Neomoorella glycerini TaxID=55779 RepID=A0A6I5ZMC8_9FIRM|nr:Holliday junction branch migration protein RuvA [Moorella glycerini]QGP90781.1 Holliday junction ATP-dependent DNA helicase RuvA [Moorella glycerini]